MATSTTAYQQQPIMRQERKKFNPHQLSEKELNELPEEEKSELVSMPVEPSSIWSEHLSQKGQTYFNTPKLIVQKIAPTFFQMLEAITPTEKSHIVFGDFCFSLGQDKVTRSKYHKISGYAASQAKAPPSKFVSQVLFMHNQDEVNDFLSQEENKNKWEQYGDWKIDPNGNVIIGLIKHSS